MSPVGTRLASFHTMLTVPRASFALPFPSLGLLTAMRGKSLAGNRLYPGTKAATIETIGTETVWLGVVPLWGIRASLLTVGVASHDGERTLVAQLNSHATNTSPDCASTAGYAPSFSQN